MIRAVGIILFLVGVTSLLQGMRTETPNWQARAAQAASSESAYRADSPLQPHGGFLVRGEIHVSPHRAAGRSVVVVELENPYPEVARFHADIREGDCANIRWGRDGTTQYELEPIVDGQQSVTIVDASVSAITTGGFVAVVMDERDLTVYACGALVPVNPVLAASAQSGTAFGRSCEAYLDGLPRKQLVALDPLDLPVGRCREQAIGAIAATSVKQLAAADYPPGEAEASMRDLRDCLIDMGYRLPPIEIALNGVITLGTGFAARQDGWAEAVVDCERETSR